jgi:hypothetical protein
MYIYTSVLFAVLSTVGFTSAAPATSDLGVGIYLHCPYYAECKSLYKKKDEAWGGAAHRWFFFFKDDYKSEKFTVRLSVKGHPDQVGTLLEVR